MRADFIIRRSRTLNPYKQKIEEIEKTIEDTEEQLHQDTQSLIEASYAQNRPAIVRRRNLCSRCALVSMSSMNNWRK